MATNCQLAFYSTDCSTVYKKLTNSNHTLMDGLMEKANFMGCFEEIDAISQNQSYLTVVTNVTLFWKEAPKGLQSICAINNSC